MFSNPKRLLRPRWGHPSILGGGRCPLPPQPALLGKRGVTGKAAIGVKTEKTQLVLWFPIQVGVWYLLWWRRFHLSDRHKETQGQTFATLRKGHLPRKQCGCRMLPPGTRGLGRIPANHDGKGRNASGSWEKGARSGREKLVRCTKSRS